MDLSPPTKRKNRESVVPMINVVFLLLIFFLMTAQIAPPEPFEVTPPQSSAEAPAEGKHILYMSASGELAMGDLRGDAVFEGLRNLGENEPLMIRADQALKANEIAKLLPKLASHGVRHVKLVSRMR
ncbi:biopolymer transporter ExbD [Lentibacter algarum]|uniref:ExbD/TolR family protein n=1 Tax=Lentibacter algarum TaxID=576131 RepID=UPI001C08223F|nr:biopolymer transporter ExbD [Lentibacter algarum]MBU2982638.1 biopolymer transporter ExbD [Lentibacter algarum]